jgi:hypothetical protein
MRLIWWITVVSFFQPTSYAFVAGETRPGVIELRSEAQGGLQVSQVSRRNSGRQSWLYFCVKNKAPRRMERCFYAQQKNYPGLKAGSVLDRIEYALSPRVHNQNGRIAIGHQRYFYPVKRLGPPAP